MDNMKKTGLNGYVYDVSVDYGAVAVDDILYDISQVFNGKELVSAMMFFSCKVLNVKPLKFVSINNQETNKDQNS